MNIFSRKRFLHRIIVASALIGLTLSLWKIGQYVWEDRLTQSAMNDMRERFYDGIGPETESSVVVTAGAGLHPQAEAPHVVTVEVHPNDESARTVAEGVYKVKQTPQRIIPEKFERLLETNEDVVGWLKIAGTPIDYPVVQAEDNEYYLRRDIHKKENSNGSIFLDYRNDATSTRHYVLYGHNMKNKSMFSTMLKYENEQFLNEHPTIEFDQLHMDGEWEIFAVQKTNIENDYIRTEFENDEQFNEFISELKEGSLYAVNVEVSPEDTILTLSTCDNVGNSRDLRFAVHARLIVSAEG